MNPPKNTMLTLHLATLPAEITDIVSDSNTLWLSVKVVILAVATFMIFMRFVRKVKGAK